MKVYRKILGVLALICGSVLIYFYTLISLVLWQARLLLP